MKILALSSEFPPYRGGIGTYAFEMAQAAHQLGAEVTVAAPDYGGERLPADRNGGFPVLRYRGGPHSFRDLPSKLTLVGRLLSQDRYDVVHAMDWPFFLPVALRAKSSQRRIHTLHGSDIIEMTAPHKRAAIRLSGLFAGSCEVVANSAFTRRLFLAEFPSVDPARVRFEHLGVSGFWGDAVSAGVAERRALVLPRTTSSSC
jgi:phosphatidyl-myo-inositol dimannoside synthase